MIGIVRFKTIGKDFYPFLFFIWLGCANESLSLVFIYSRGSNTVNSNIYVLLEFLIILFQFRTWNNDVIGKYLFFAALGVVVWVADNFFVNTIHENNSIFRIVYSLIIVFFSLRQVGQILIFEKISLLTNASFIICIAFLFYYGCKVFVEIFNSFHLGLSNMFYWNLWITSYFINFVANLLYATAILCIPTKREFTLPY